VEVAISNAGGKGGGFAHGIDGCRKKGRRNEEWKRAGEGGAKAGRLAASEDTAKAGEPAGCHLPSRGPTEGSLFLGTWG
jgi:hypothetical protein